MAGMDYLVRLVIRIDESTKANVIAANHFVSFFDCCRTCIVELFVHVGSVKLCKMDEMLMRFLITSTIVLIVCYFDFQSNQ